MTSLHDLYDFYCRRSGCRPNTRFAQQLKDGQHSSFDFSDNLVGPKGLSPVLEIARNNASLETLDLSGNWLAKEGVQRVVEMAVRHPTLRKLCLRDNPIHGASYKLLSYLLVNNQNIVLLDVDGTELSDHHKERLAASLSRNVTDPQESRMPRATYTRVSARQALHQPEPVAAEATGVWQGVTAGGCLNYTTWRHNPQFLLYVSRPCTVTITLSQRNAAHHIGVLVAKRRELTSARLLRIPAIDVLRESGFGNEQPAKTTVVLDACTKGKDAPYTVIPMCFYPDREARFVLRCAELSNDAFSATERVGPPQITLEEIPADLDWYRHPAIEGNWSAATSGGCKRHASWRSNPQYLLKTRVSGRAATKVCIFLSKSIDEEDEDERSIGFYLLRGDSGGRRKIFMTTEDFAGESAFRQTNEVYLETALIGGREDGYIIIPCCEEPGQVGKFSLRVYSAGVVTVEELPRHRDWRETVVQGSWSPGADGGARAGASRQSWVQNPSFSLVLSAPTDVLLLLERKSGPDADPHNRREVRHSLTLTDDTAAFGEVAATPFSTREQECALWLPKLEKYVTDYIVVPHTEQQGQHGRYTMRLYSSLPVTVGTEKSIEGRAYDKALAKYQQENASALRQRDLAQPDDYFRPPAASAAGGHDAVRERDTITARYLTTGVPHVDKQFPPGASSIWRDPDCPGRQLPIKAWKRPRDCWPETVLFKGGQKGGGVLQGHIESSWVLGALGLVATRPELVRHLFVAAYPEYGFYQVRVYKYGQWRTITIDDLLPVDASAEQQLVFASSPQSEELWPAYAEKAYAKLHGSYQALEGSPLVAHALEDFTGGQVETINLLDEAAKELVRSGVLWTRIQGALRNKWLVGGQLLSSRGTRHDEKRSMGITPDRLFGVLEARDLLGRRLLRLRDPWDLAPWRGRWSCGSKQWTQEVLDALDLKPDSNDGTFWMAWEDFPYYFNELTVCRMHSSECASSDHWHQAQVAGEWTRDTSGGCALSGGDDWLSNPQYSLEVPGAMEGEEVPVWLSLQQPDARLRSIANVDENGGLTYRNEIGFHVIASDSSDRRLLSFPVDSDDEMYTCHPAATRETGRELMLRPGSKSHIIIPCCGSKGVPGEFLLTAACTKKVNVRLIKTDLGVVAPGCWKGQTAGGAPGVFGSWRNNPMYLLSPSQATTLTVVLCQKNELCSTTAKIGFMVLSARHVRRPLSIEEEDVVARTDYLNQSRVAQRVEVQGIKERSGQPYVIVPTTYYPGQESDFELHVVGNKRVALTPLDPKLDWGHCSAADSWSHEGNTAGGSLGYPTWRLSPQYTLHFTDKVATVALVVSKRLPLCVENDSTQIGVTVLKCGGAEGGVRKKLTYEKVDIVGAVESTEHENNVELNLTLESNVGDGYMIIPHTKYPYTDGGFNIDLYSASMLTLRRVVPEQDWRHIKHEGEWLPGVTAGGAREKHRSWINNPNYLLTLGSTATVVLILSQHPLQPGQVKGHRREAPPKGKGHFERYRPPLVTDTRNNNDIGVDLCHHDEELTHIDRSRYTYNCEVSLSVPRLRSGQYVVVPHTFQAEQDCVFTLQVYTDCTDFTFTKIEKERKFY
eukprot:TRINITY_DN3779_c0_g1_i1.p1 TRINITY_DN3779_c0_g1~~TRINITY_DN3779_c0_g1_i1.p1  ORF type:complete len:1589 (+),score=470.00 TRINITY_DN3779_c0_g1_i1:64-4830(+)